MRTWIDVTLPITADGVAWSGIAPPAWRWIARIGAGASVNVGRLDCCTHTGTHADAPLHVVDGGAAIDRLDPALYVGPAVVLRLEQPEAISVDGLRAAGWDVVARDGHGPIERVLVATPTPYDGIDFPERVPQLTVEAARFLAEAGVRLIGVDVPSIDPLDSKTLDAHRAVFGAGMAVLENLDLRGIPTGRYDLAAAPIRVAGADAAPVRALVRPWASTASGMELPRLGGHR